MLFNNIAVLTENKTVKPDCFVITEADRITYIGDKKPQNYFGREYDGRGKLLLPAFFNVHSHLTMAPLRGFGENLPLHEWLQTRIFPFEARLSDEDIFWGALAGITEALRFGIASCSDMYSRNEAIVRAVIGSGIKANIGVDLLCFDNSNLTHLPQFTLLDYLLKTYDGAEGGRVRIACSVHAEYTSTEKIVRQAAEYAQKKECLVHLHLSETAKEHNECKQRHAGKTPAQYFRDCGFFARPATAAHCIWLEGEDFEILRANGVSVASCPKSNLKLGSGICNAHKLLDMGINLAIATDGVASNNNLNMLEEMKVFALLQNGLNGTGSLFNPAQVLAMATRAGALAQMRTESGIIATGAKADLTVIDMSQIYWRPQTDILANLLYAACGTDVCLTMVDGKVLFEDGDYPTIDAERVAWEIEQTAQRIGYELKASK